MLPISLRAVYALNAATFQVSSLALLSIVNTRVGIPPEYLPAYGAISFLPYSLRPIFAWVSSLLLSRTKHDRANSSSSSSSSSSTVNTTNNNRHDKLLFPAFLLSCLAMGGSIFIPSGGTILCFVFGFLRGIAGAWSDFLIGMTVIEFSRLQVQFLPSLSNSPGGNNNNSKRSDYVSYEHVVSVNTAQSSTAKNVGSFLASIGTYFFFFARDNRELGEKVANTLILGTAGIFFLASLASLKYQCHVGKLIANFSSYDAIDDHDVELTADTGVALSSSGTVELEQQQQQPVRLENSEGDNTITIPSTTNLHANDVDGFDNKGSTTHWQQITEVSTLVSFQTLLAVSALRKPLIAISNQTTWISIMVVMAIALVIAIGVGYHHEQKNTVASLSPGKEEDVNNNNNNIHSQKKRLPHRQLNLYFLLRYAMPIAGFLMYSYLYTVFESEPEFLQLLSVMKTAIGSVSTFFYEKFLSPYCHSGWPLIGLIASLDIVMGLVALLDIWVVRTVREKEVDGQYTIDTSLRCLVAVVGLTKYFFAELDYLPALVLSTTNVYSVDDIPTKDQNDAHSNGSDRPRMNSLDIDFNNEEESDGNGTTTLRNRTTAQRLPAISAGMQYASFLSCIDFGAQIGDWISVPIIASLGITRENHWDDLDRFIVLCSVFRMVRVVFLWLICPPIRLRKIGT